MARAAATTSTVHVLNAFIIIAILFCSSCPLLPPPCFSSFFVSAFTNVAEYNSCLNLFQRRPQQQRHPRGGGAGRKRPCFPSLLLRPRQQEQQRRREEGGGGGMTLVPNLTTTTTTTSFTALLLVVMTFFRDCNMAAHYHFDANDNNDDTFNTSSSSSSLSFLSSSTDPSCTTRKRLSSLSLSVLFPRHTYSVLSSTTLLQARKRRQVNDDGSNKNKKDLGNNFFLANFIDFLFRILSFPIPVPFLPPSSSSSSYSKNKNKKNTNAFSSSSLVSKSRIKIFGTVPLFYPVCLILFSLRIPIGTAILMNGFFVSYLFVGRKLLLDSSSEEDDEDDDEQEINVLTGKQENDKVCSDKKEWNDNKEEEEDEPPEFIADLIALVGAIASAGLLSPYGFFGGGGGGSRIATFFSSSALSSPSSATTTTTAFIGSLGGSRIGSAAAAAAAIGGGNGFNLWEMLLGITAIGLAGVLVMMNNTDFDNIATFNRAGGDHDEGDDDVDDIIELRTQQQLLDLWDEQLENSADGDDNDNDY